MKYTFSKIVEGEYYLIDDCIDHNGTVYGVDGFCCDDCCFLVPENFVRKFGRVRNDNFGDVEFNQEGFFKYIKNSLYKLIFCIRVCCIIIFKPLLPLLVN